MAIVVHSIGSLCHFMIASLTLEGDIEAAANVLATYHEIQARK